MPTWGEERPACKNCHHPAAHHIPLSMYNDRCAEKSCPCDFYEPQYPI